MKKILFAALFACLALGLSAQQSDPFARKFSLGVEGGIGDVSHWHTEGNVTGKPDFGATLGLAGYLRLSDDWFLISQPQFELRNAKGIYGKFNSQNLVVPVTIAVSFRIPNQHSKKPNRMFFAMGPYYGYTFSGKAAGEKLDFDAWNRSEWGFQANISYFIGRCGLGITARESASKMLRDIPKGQANLENQSAMWTFTWLF